MEDQVGPYLSYKSDKNKIDIEWDIDQKIQTKKNTKNNLRQSLINGNIINDKYIDIC